MLQALTIAASVVPNKTPKPILRNVRVDAQGGKAIVSATDTELNARIEVDGVECQSVGKCLLPADRFTSILREAVDPQVRVSLDGTHATIRSGRDRFRLPLASTDDFPTVPAPIIHDYHETSASDLRMLLERTAYASDSESSRYALNGVLFEFQNDRIDCVATDGRRLSHVSATAVRHGEGRGPGSTTIIPSHAISVLLKAFDGEGAIRVSVDQNTASFQTDNAFVSCRLVEGRFPAWRSVMPDKWESEAVANAKAVLSAIRRATVVAGSEDRSLEFAFGDGMLAMAGSEAEIGDSQVEIPIEFSGPSVKIRLNSRYVADFLKPLSPEDSIHVRLSGPNQGAVLVQGSSSCVIMPMGKP